jgi:3D (Asp-Asp-Asp) domain-containing protein
MNQRLSQKQKPIRTAVLGIIAYQLLFPHSVFAADVNGTVRLAGLFQAPATSEVIMSDDAEIISQNKAVVTIPEIIPPKPEYRVVRSYTVSSSAYNSEPGQTDNSPCTTANGYNVCTADEENVVAANNLKFGTKIRIPDQFGDRIFTVQDRMNSRYKTNVDIWMRNRADAIKYGRRTVRIEVVEEVSVEQALAQK